MSKLHDLYKKLDDQLRDAEWDAAVEVADKILAQKADEKEAFKSKLYALLQADKFQEVINAVSGGKDKTFDAIFEHAYALYRTKQFAGALQLINSQPQQSLSQSMLHLRSQIYFRLEDAKCVEAYEELMSKHKLESAELLTNLTAALCRAKALNKSDTLFSKYRKVMKESHEFMYNAACCYIESGALDAAQQCLEAAASICRESMKRDGASEQEILDELAYIQAQQAYIMQRRGKEKEAMDQYEEILKHNVSDVAVVAVCNNNIVALRKEHDRFNSANKLKHLGSDQVQEKLSFAQKKAIYFNRCVLFLQMNKAQECRDLLKSFETDFPDSEYIPLINAALLVREKHWDDGEKILKDYIGKRRGQDCVRVQLSLAQIQLGRGDHASVIATLKSIDALKNTPAMISALAKLMEQSGDVEAAIRIVDEAAAKISGDGADESAIQMLKRSVDFKMKNRRHREAALALEKILKSNPGDLEALPKLVIAYAAFDADQAEKYAKRLPQQQIKSVPSEEVDKLENIAPRTSYKKAVAATDGEKPAADAVIRTKPKKKKKNKNPPAKKADFSRPPDPERWLPKRERSTYKGPRRRGQKNTGGRSMGAQGSTTVSDAHSQAVRGTPLAKAKEDEPPAPAPAPSKQPPPRAAPKKTNRRKR